MIGRFLDKFDTDIKFQFDIKIKEQKIKKFILELKLLKEKVENRKRMFWILDFHLDFEPFQLWDDQKKQRI
jgi:hypothetical protein